MVWKRWFVVVVVVQLWFQEVGSRSTDTKVVVEEEVFGSRWIQSRGCEGS